jgi:hypothetical protein
MNLEDMRTGEVLYQLIGIRIGGYFIIIPTVTISLRAITTIPQQKNNRLNLNLDTTPNTR